MGFYLNWSQFCIVFFRFNFRCGLSSFVLCRPLFRSQIIVAYMDFSLEHIQIKKRKLREERRQKEDKVTWKCQKMLCECSTLICYMGSFFCLHVALVLNCTGKWYGFESSASAIVRSGAKLVRVGSSLENIEFIAIVTFDGIVVLLLFSSVYFRIMWHLFHCQLPRKSWLTTKPHNCRFWNEHSSILHWLFPCSPLIMRLNVMCIICMISPTFAVSQYLHRTECP